MADQYPLNSNAVNQMIYDLTAILDNPTAFTASGRQPVNVHTSRARLPGVEMSPRTGAGAALLTDNMLRNPLAKPTTLQDMSKQLLRARIDEILSPLDLNLPTHPPAPPAPVPKRVPLMEVANKLSPALLLLDLLTQTTDLNRGEDEELAKRKTQPATIDSSKRPS